MNTILVIGIILAVGFVFGEIASKLKLPKVTGYILAGICLDPELSHIIPMDFTSHTDPAINISLSFITFSVGTSLQFSRLRELGKTILLITFFEAEGALLVVVLGFITFLYLLGTHTIPAWSGMYLVPSILLAALASPTDPSATLAVTHEYQAKGNVTSTIMAVAGLDDVLGIINYSFCIALARVLTAHSVFNILPSLINPLISIGGGIGIGIGFGIAFNTITVVTRRETEGSLIVFSFALLSLCFGFAEYMGVDKLLATMAMGCVVVNFNIMQKKILRLLQRYTEELIFVLFFTLSGMHLEFSALSKGLPFVVAFVVLRGIGKIAGTTLGAGIAHAPKNLGKYTSLGLIPQGGIVIGLALLIKSDPAFASISDAVIAVIIGATVIHELVGPLIAKISLRKAGEIP